MILLINGKFVKESRITTARNQRVFGIFHVLHLSAYRADIPY